jgi:Carboxypeptidase regulatory-like domain/TonB-dependent Receptor Plug Domain
MSNGTVSVVIRSALVCAIPGLLSAQVSAAADPPATYQVTGVITDAAREPVPNADVMVGDSSVTTRAAVTDSRGRFTLGRFPAGPLSLHVRRIGYEARTIKVEVGAGGQPTSVEIVLLAVPAELAGVSVTADARGRLREFYLRREERAAFGRFLDSEDIRRRGPANASDLFRTVPGVSIKNNPAAGGNAVRIRNCQPMVWVDGQRAPGAELDEVIRPEEIAAIEFYPSSAGTPAQYLERENRLCGLILVWTKSE